MSRPGGKQLYAIAQRGVDIIIELNDTLVDLMATDDDVEYELIENVKQKLSLTRQNMSHWLTSLQNNAHRMTPEELEHLESMLWEENGMIKGYVEELIEHFHRVIEAVQDGEQDMSMKVLYCWFDARTAIQALGEELDEALGLAE